MAIDCRADLDNVIVIIVIIVVVIIVNNYLDMPPSGTLSTDMSTLPREVRWDKNK